MDGLLVVNKPSGPTSHDVVARIRLALGEPRVGHTGTLDPAASGVLPLLLGRATRLAQFLGGAQKSYQAIVRLGIETDSYDATGRITGSPSDPPYPTEAEIERALNQFRGDFLQQPPAFSAKKIGGRRSYRIARGARQGPADPSTRPALPAPAAVTAHSIVVVGAAADTVTLIVDCSAGFYVRSLAHDLGSVLGIGAHLASLTRLRSGAFRLEDAVELDAIERDPNAGAARLVPLVDILSHLSSVVLTADGVRKATHGGELGPAEAAGTAFRTLLETSASEAAFVRLLTTEGELVGIAERSATRGLLHPSVILM